MGLVDSGFNTAGNLLAHAGVPGKRRELERSAARGGLRVNDNARGLDAPVGEGDVIGVGIEEYRAVAGGGRGRLQLVPHEGPVPVGIRSPVRVHCGLHKSLTEYFKKIYNRLCHPPIRLNASFRHYFHRVDFFHAYCGADAVSSVSGQLPQLDRFDDIRVVQVVRDPRDLLVSGYFYHKRAAEHWCALPDPTDIDWRIVAGCVPGDLPAGTSLSAYLNDASTERGLFAELDFRRRHFESMRQWPMHDERIRTFRYEDIVGNEVAVLGEIAEFFGWPALARFAAGHYARRYRAANAVRQSSHIRNPSSGQWREHFTPALEREFNAAWGDLLNRYGYSG